LLPVVESLSCAPYIGALPVGLERAFKVAGMWRSLPALLVAAIVLAAVQPAHAAPVAKPRFVQNIPTGETGWFASPALVDLTGDKRLEIVAPAYSTSTSVYAATVDAPLRPFPCRAGGHGRRTPEMAH
jgi:hypothetical protein